MSVSGWVDGRWYVTKWSDKESKWQVVWVRRAKDKPSISKWARPTDRDPHLAQWAKKEHAERYINMIASGENKGKFEIYDG